MAIVKSKDKSKQWKHYKEGYIIWDLLNKKDIHTQKRGRIYLGRMWPHLDLNNPSWYWESAWGFNQGQARDDLAALEMIKIVAHNRFATTHKIKDVRV